MAQYSYRVKTLDGKTEHGTAEAASRNELLSRLRDAGKYCYRIEEKKSAVKETVPLKRRELILFCSQMSAMLSAGIGMAHALNTLYEVGVSRNLKSAALSLYESVLGGFPLSAGMKKQGRTFPELLIYMTEAGEASGDLDHILETMAGHYTTEEEMNKKVRNSMTYPVILGVVSIVVVVFLLTNILPTFIGMYGDTPLPVPTRILIAISNFLTYRWKYLIAGALFLALLFSWLNTRKWYRRAVGKRKLNNPFMGIGKLRRTILTSRFASTFAVLFMSGTGILQCMEISSRVMNDAYVEECLTKASAGLEKGHSLSESLGDAGIFDKMLLMMTETGEESGNLDNMLKQAGEYYKRESESALSRLIAMIDPVMIIVFGIVIGFIVIAIMLPIFSMYQQIL